MSFEHGTLTLALAMLAGVIAQGAARHLRVPGIVVLLVLGVVLGPDGVDIVRPLTLGSALPAFVGFAASIILFEGALHVRVASLTHQAGPIRWLVTVGALVTGVLATLLALLLMPWGFPLSVLFGSLVMVTGPTVVNPIVRRLRLEPHLAKILIAEGIFVDAFGATIAVVVLEIVLAETDSAAAGEALTVFTRFGVGALVGGAAGLGLVGLLRVRRLVPAGLENVLALGVAVASFQIGDAIVQESGLTAAIVAGLVVGNLPTRRLHKIAEFKEQLTDLLVATLFVLLSANVRMSDVVALGWGGIGVVAALLFVIRPIAVFASTARSDLTTADKLTLSWIAPRGIVAAAVASLFAAKLGEAGIAGGNELRALVFVVIASSVTLQGLSAGVVTQWLGVRRPARGGALVLGANALACAFARVLGSLGERVLLIESNDTLVARAHRQGLDVIQGDGLAAATFAEAGVEGMKWCIGMTSNEHINFNFARLIHEDYRGPHVGVMLERHDQGVTPEMADQHDLAVLLAGETNILLWLDQARRKGTEVQRWTLEAPTELAPLAELSEDCVLPLVLVRGEEIHLVTPLSSPRAGDELHALIIVAARDAARTWLGARGWVPVAADAPLAVAHLV